jgi:excisionase family DNA binding protein
VTLKEAAERLAVTPDNLRGAIARGSLRAVKHGRDWWVTEAEIERYQREQLGQPGRKPGGRNKRTKP